MSASPAPAVHTFDPLPAVATRRLEVAPIAVEVHALSPNSGVVVHGIDVAPELPAVFGRRFFLAAQTAEEIEAASPFGDAFSGSPRDEDWNAAAPEMDGTDPARAFYLLLMPPLEDVLRGGFDLPHPLYGFQAEGVAFLAKRRYALLADDMGLGKTIQTIVALRILLGSRFVKRALIVCPSGLKTNWRAEFGKWAPEVAVQVIQGDASRRRSQWHSPAHVLIANYEIIRNDREWMPQEPFDLVVLDEAQRIKNGATATARAVKAIPRRAAWVLTGTPIENGLSDLVSIFSFLKPDLPLTEEATPEEARAIAAPYLLRREKTAVLDELPPKREHTAYLDLTEAQYESYRIAEEEGNVYLRGLGDTVTLQHVLALLTKLKQICNFDPKTGESAKLDYLRDSLEVIAARGEKVLVFSQYTQTLDFLAERLTEFMPLAYHGGLSRRQKDAVLEQFRSDRRHVVLLISLQAGGVGLNLQEASYVYHFDRWWNPAVERQAEDRAYRLGQRSEVLVTRLVMRDTIEERIHRILEEKEALFRRFVDEKDGKGGRADRLTDGEYFDLVGLDPALAKARRPAS